MGMIDRRTFVSAGVAATATAAMALSQKGDAKPTGGSPNEQINIGIVGQGVRGQSLLPNFHRPDRNVVVRAVCDPRSDILGQQVEAFSKKYRTSVDSHRDMREMFDRTDIDAVVIAAPNHWHTLATIWGVQAGKDVYCEKPATHNLWEMNQLLGAIDPQKRIVQHGVQLRSAPAIQEGVAKMKEGAIGKVYMGRAVIFRRREGIGPKKLATPPDTLDWNLYRGPSTTEEYIEGLTENGNWHHFWTFGGGDIMNQGVHELDLALWGLGLDEYPSDVVASGGSYLWQDAKEVPEVLNANARYAESNKLIDVAVRHWCSNFEDDVFTGNIFYGEEGVMLVSGYVRYKIIMGEGKGRQAGRWIDSGDPQQAHVDNFIQAVRSRKTTELNAPIATATACCGLGHLANIAFRTAEKVVADPKTGRVLSPEGTEGYFKREYREGFVVPELSTS
jgi:predicted dehydrogenase